MKQYLILFFSLWIPLFAMGEPIDRETVVKRHKVFTTATLPKSPAQVGNGKFAFGMDITGLQTSCLLIPFPIGGWHSYPLPEGVKVEDYQPVVVESHGKKIPYWGSGSSTSGDNQLVDAESTPH